MLRDTTPKPRLMPKKSHSYGKFGYIFGLVCYLVLMLYIGYWNETHTQRMKPFYDGPWKVYSAKNPGRVEDILKRNGYPGLLERAGYDPDMNRLRDSIDARNPYVNGNLLIIGEPISLPDIEYLSRKR